MNNENYDVPIDYRYLNLDNKTFYPSQVELTDSMGKKGFLKSFDNGPELNQVLIAGSQREFTQCEAILTCRKLTGVLRARP